jgi:hypothetical protein
VIKVEYNVKFPKDFDMSILQSNPRLVELFGIFDLCREEAVRRNCTYFRDNNEETSYTIFFIWFDHQECADFVQWSNDTHNYSSVYAEMVNILSSYNATIVRDESIS